MLYSENLHVSFGDKPILNGDDPRLARPRCMRQHEAAEANEAVWADVCG